jgi:hypothetical protein
MIKVTSQHNYCLIEPDGPLSRDDFDAIARHIDPVIEAGGQLDGLIIKTRSFPGWESLGGLIEHFRFVRDHHRAIQRVALVTDTPLANLLPAIVGHFVSAEVRQFNFDDDDDAIEWMQSSGGLE